uniref:Secreted protein n=1 Tax=Arundo donax TaxID=35708 RepID=A0A0A9BNU4_ARUDO
MDQNLCKMLCLVVVLSERVASLQHAVARPLLGGGQLEELLPELGGDRVRLVAHQRREHLLRRAGRRRCPRGAQSRRRRRRAHWI